MVKNIESHTTVPENMIRLAGRTVDAHGVKVTDPMQSESASR